MMKKLFLVLPIVLFTQAALDVASNSAPASSSGAPGETDCTTSGCHDTYPVNQGPGSAYISFENGNTDYVPGQTYTISVMVQQNNLVRFGFQLVALDEQNQNAGSLMPIDNSRNQVTRGYHNLADRRYMTYTFESTLAKVAGYNTWNFIWIAPPVTQGKITFYLASLAANNNGNDAGDYCYTVSRSLNAKQTALPSEFTMNVYTDVVNELLCVRYALPEDATVKVELVNSLGQVVQTAEPGLQVAGQYTLPFNLIKEYGKGLYSLRLTQNEKVAVKKIILAK